MSGWTAIVALKGGDTRKSRLASRLSAGKRHALAERLARHVVGCLLASPGIAEVRLLSPEPPAMTGVRWAHDAGEGLNAELGRLRAAIGGDPVLVIHPDLPLMTVADVGALCRAAESAGAAIAVDRHASGTNAIAIADGRAFDFLFGIASFAAHRAALGRHCAIVRRAGLALDLDTPDDLDVAVAAGFVLRDLPEERRSALPRP